MGQVLVRAPLVEQAIASLRDQVAAGVWGVGAQLPAEPVLACELGVGRSTVREAVRALAHAGVLEVRQGSGTFVRAAPGAAELTLWLKRAGALEVYEVRRALEVEAAGSAGRRNDQDLARIDAALVRRRAGAQARDHAQLLAGDLEFHWAVVDAAHNPLLSELYAVALASISQAIEDVVGDRALSEDTSGLHDALVDALRRQDRDAAVAAVRTHLDGAHRALGRLVGR